jgi:hypothetical protein
MWATRSIAAQPHISEDRVKAVTSLIGRERMSSG